MLGLGKIDQSNVPPRSSSFGPQYDGNNRGKNGVNKGTGIDGLYACIRM
jgi:hypothetical protein